MKQEKNQNRASKSCGSILSGLVSNMYITGIPEEERNNGSEEIVEKITDKNNGRQQMTDPGPESPNQDKYLKTKQNKKKSTNLDTVKPQKTKDKEENLQSSQRKKPHCIQRNKD